MSSYNIWPRVFLKLNFVIFLTFPGFSTLVAEGHPTANRVGKNQVEQKYRKNNIFKNSFVLNSICIDFLNLAFKMLKYIWNSCT